MENTKIDWSYDKFENALNKKEISVDMMINILKYMDIVKLFKLSLELNHKKYPLLCGILASDKLWVTKVKFIEDQVKFSLDTYIKISNNDNNISDTSKYYNFLSELYNNIIVFIKAIDIWTHNCMREEEKYDCDRDDLFDNIVSDIMFYISENGFIGLILAMGYANPVLCNNNFSKNLFLQCISYRYERCALTPYNIHIGKHKYNTLYNGGLWKRYFTHMEFDHNLTIKICGKDEDGYNFDYYTRMCRFSGFSQNIIQLITDEINNNNNDDYSGDNVSEFILSDFIMEIIDIINIINNLEFKKHLIDNLLYAYSKLNDSDKIFVRENFREYFI